MINDLDMQSWAYLLNPTFQFVNTAGKPLTEGYLEVYIAGTRDKYYCASDFDGTLHPFQIPLDSLGANIVLADPNQAYDVYVYNRFGSLIMSRYNVSPGNTGSGGVSMTTVTSQDNTVNITHSGNNYDLSIKDTIDRIDNLEDKYGNLGASTDYAVSYGYGDGGEFVLTDKASTGVNYLNDMSGWRLKPGHVYQLNYNAKFTCDEQTNKLVDGKFYLDGDMSFSQDWNFNLDDSYDYSQSFNGSTIIVVPSTLQYYDLKLKYTFNSVVNCQVDLENISIVDITSTTNMGGGGAVYYEGDGININNNFISVDMDYINEHLDIDANSILSSAYSYTDARVTQASGDIINIIAEATGNLPIPEQVQSDWEEDNTSSPAYIQHKPEEEEIDFEEINLSDYALASAIPDVSNLVTHNELNIASGNIINYVNEQIGEIPPQVQSDWEQTASGEPDYIKNKPEEEEIDFEEINLSDYALASSIPDISNLATKDELNIASGTIINYVDNSIESASGNIINYVDNSIDDVSAAIPTLPEEEEVEFEEIDVSSYATHNEVYTATSSAVSSANLYTDTAIANLDLTPAVEIVSPLNSISVSSTVDQVHNTKTFYIDTNDPETKYYVGEARFTLSDTSSQGTVGYYKNIDDYATKFSGNIDLNNLNKGLYLLTANINCVASSANNDLMELQISSSSGSAITYLSAEYPIDCSVVDTYGDPSTVSHQIATLVRVVYDGSKLNLVARIDNPTTVSNVLNVWVSDLCLYEVKTTSGASSSSPSASGSYEDGWGIIINGNVISVNPSIIPDTSNLATHNEVITYATSAINVANDYTDNAINNLNLNQYATDVEVYNATVTAIQAATGNLPSQVQSDWTEVNTSAPSYIQHKPNERQLIPGANISISASGSNYVISSTGGSSEQVQSDWTEDDTTDPSYILNKPNELELVAGNNINITVSGTNIVISSTASGGGSGTTYTEGTGIDINNNVISVDTSVVALASSIPDTSDMATQTWVGSQGYLTSIPSSYATDSEVNAAIATAVNDMATKTWVGNQGYLTSIPSSYATDTEVYNATVTAIQTATANVPAQIQSDWAQTASGSVDYIKNKPEVEEIGLCPIIAGNNITITASGDSAVISSTASGGGTTYSEGFGIDINNNTISVDTSIVALASAIPDTSDMATKTWVGSQGYLTSIPSQYITESELSSELNDYALASAIPDEEEVDFEEIDLSNYALASAIPDVSNFATESYVNNAIANIPEVSGASGISVNDNVVSLDNPVGLVAGENISITVSGDSAIISGQAGGSSYSEGTGIDITNNVISVDTSTIATQTWVGNQGYLTSIPSTYATDSEVQTAIQSATANLPQSDWTESNTSSMAYIQHKPEIVEVSFCPILAGSGVTISASGDSAVINASVDTSTFATKAELQTVSAAIPDTSDMATKTWVGNQGYLTSIPSSYATDVEVTQAVTGATQNMVSYSGNTAINHIQLVSTLPASPDANTLYLIPEV